MWFVDYLGHRWVGVLLSTCFTCCKVYYDYQTLGPTVGISVGLFSGSLVWMVIMPLDVVLPYVYTPLVCIGVLVPGFLLSVLIGILVGGFVYCIYGENEGFVLFLGCSGLGSVYCIYEFYRTIGISEIFALLSSNVQGRLTCDFITFTIAVFFLQHKSMLKIGADVADWQGAVLVPRNSKEYSLQYKYLQATAKQWKHKYQFDLCLDKMYRIYPKEKLLPQQQVLSPASVMLPGTDVVVTATFMSGLELSSASSLQFVSSPSDLQDQGDDSKDFHNSDPSSFEIADRVMCRDKGQWWWTGTVTNRFPELEVRADGWQFSCSWDEVKRLLPKMNKPTSAREQPVNHPIEDQPLEIRQGLCGKVQHLSHDGEFACINFQGIPSPKKVMACKFPCLAMRRATVGDTVTVIAGNHAGKNFAVVEDKGCKSYRSYKLQGLPRVMFRQDDVRLMSVEDPEEVPYLADVDPQGTSTLRLFHGTDWTAAKAIVHDGYRLPLGAGMVRSGSMFGRGIYFADTPQKSWQYATRAFGGTGIVLLNRVELGAAKLKKRAGSSESGYQGNLLRRARSAYHSVIGLTMDQGGELRVPEYIVYDPLQARVEYVLVFRQVRTGRGLTA